MNLVNPLPAVNVGTAVRSSFLIAIALLLFALPSGAHAADPSPIDWSIDQNSLKAVDAQEESWLSDGDEPYIAVIGFRARFGQVGSTQTAFIGGLKELHSGADDGDSMSIPDSMGRTNFFDVTRINGTEIVLGGMNPEIVGTVTVAMESDSTPFSIMSTGFREAARVARREIAAIVETTTIQQIIADPATFQQKTTDMANRLRKRAELSIWQDIGNFIVSFSDPDDRIGVKVAMFLGLQSPLVTAQELALLRIFAPAQASMVENLDATLAAAVPPSQGIVGTLKPRNFTQDFAGDGATYRVSYSVFPF